MKTKITLLVTLFIFTQYLFAQQAVEESMVVEEKEKHIYGIDGTHLLEKQDAEVAQFLRENPDYFEKVKLNKTSAWDFNVGDTRTWIAVNFTTNANYNVASTCRAVGTHCYVFVENTQWGNRVTQATVDAVVNAFDNQTPINPSKGIFQTNVETFGDPPDADNDPKIIIFLLDIRDGFDGSGGYIAGYFFSQNEISDNRAEIFFIDTYPLNLTTSDGLAEGLSTLAHEFQHMIHWNYHRTSSSLTFINEGCSLIAEYVNGYALREQVRYANETNHYLYDWRSSLSDAVLIDYSRAAKFTLYLYEQFGIEILKNIVQTTATGLNTYPSALTRMNASITFDQVLQNWFIANVVNDRSIKDEWGYLYTPIVKSNGITNYNPTINRGGTLDQFAVEYVSFVNGELLEVNFSTTSPSLITKVLKEGPGKKEIVDITPGITFSEPEFGSTYTNITLIIMNPTNTTEQPYSINAMGRAKTVELTSFYGNEPMGTISLPAGDTICVFFDRIQGGRLDSIKVAARRVGYIEGSVHYFTGVSRPTPIGNRLSEPFHLTSTSTPPVINSGATFPYEIPWPNWVKQDFTGENISTNFPFCCVFWIPQDIDNYALIMNSIIPEGEDVNVYTYRTTASSGPGWYITTGARDDGTSGAWLFHMIAYVGFENEPRIEVVELLPSYFKLEQNYPNPFNPSTKIQYTLEKVGMTKLTVYDMLGRELSTLVNEKKDAGTYEVTFNATNYASGIYYYKLQSNNIVQTKKMMLLK